MNKVLKTKDDVKVPVGSIESLSIYNEQCDGDTEFDNINYWELLAHLHNGETVLLYEANGFDNKAETFFYFEAVEGGNYRKIVALKEKIQKLVDENTEIINIETM